MTRQSIQEELDAISDSIDNLTMIVDRTDEEKRDLEKLRNREAELKVRLAEHEGRETSERKTLEGM